MNLIAVVFATALLNFVSTKYVTEEKCQQIRNAAQRWKPSPLSPYNDADHISNGLYIGNVCAAHNDEWLKKEGITMVISVAREWDYLAQGKGKGVAFHYFDIDDSVNENRDRILRLFKEIALLIHRELTVRGGKVLVHCNMGISRSSSVVLWYLEHYVYPHLSHDAVLKWVTQKRPVVRPNRLFNYILREKR